MLAITPLKIIIGYDEVEIVAWHTLTQSIIDQSSIPVSFMPLKLDHLSSLYSRKRDPRQSNAFSFTRFLTPSLCDFEGLALFMDCDMLMRVDIAEVLTAMKRDPGKAVYVVKHDYESKVAVKYLGNTQYTYPRKNWSSFILWNCSHSSNKTLTPQVVNTAEPRFLHRFEWLQDSEIGELDLGWNWLVGEYDDEEKDAVKNVHWTLGGPYFNEYSNVPFSDEWRLTKDRINSCRQLSDPSLNTSS